MTMRLMVLVGFLVAAVVAAVDAQSGGCCAPSSFKASFEASVGGVPVTGVMYYNAETFGSRIDVHQ